MADEAIGIQRESGVATITFDRPDVKNALTPAEFDRLRERFDEVAANPDDRVVILTGAGDAFCAGANLAGSNGSAERMAQGPIARGQFTRAATAPALALHRIPKPTIAAVNGVAAGGGCNLALGCDIVFASESARFAEVFINRGLTLDYGGTWLLPRLIGLQRAKDLAFRGELLSARDAEALGLVLEVLPAAGLLDRVSQYARELAAKPPVALSLIKSGLNRATTWGFEEGLEFEAEAQATCLGTEDFREALRSWFQKRPGVYRGE